MKGGSQSSSYRGLNLPGHVRRQLREVGILARPEVGLEHQHLALRYVIRGVESGGAIREIGHYVTFCGEDGEPLAYLHPIDAIGVNGVHAVVVAPVLVRVEMLRTGRTYELLITGFRIGEAENGRRPPLESQTLFRGVHGYLESNCGGRTKRAPGQWCRPSTRGEESVCKCPQNSMRLLAPLSKRWRAADVRIVTIWLLHLLPHHSKLSRRCTRDTRR